MVLLLTIVLRQVQWHDLTTVDEAGQTSTIPGVASNLKGVSPLFLLAAWASLFTAVTLSGARWYRLLLGIGISFRLKELIRLVYIGEFFNNFLPGSLGGDAVKIYLSLKNSSRKTAILTSIFADRLLGLMSLSLIAAVMLGYQVLQGNISGEALLLPLFPLALIGFGLTGGALLLFSDPLWALLGLNRFLDRIPFADQIRRGGGILRELATNRRDLPMIILYSLGCQTFSIIGVAFLGASLDLGLSLPQYLMSVPLIFILSAVPLTPGGVGLLEELFLIYLAAAHNPNKILIMALLYRLLMILCGLPGLILFLTAGATERKLLKTGDRNSGL